MEDIKTIRLFDGNQYKCKKELFKVGDVIIPNPEFPSFEEHQTFKIATEQDVLNYISGCQCHSKEFYKCVGTSNSNI